MTEANANHTTVKDIARAMEAIAPLRLAQLWDNVGLLTGDPGARCRRILLCIDLTPAVLEEAIAGKCECVVAYHPVLFKTVGRLLADSRESDAIVHRAIASGIAIYSPHTALDAADGGTNDVLAGMCKLTDVEPFEYVGGQKSESKLVTFVPEKDLDRVASAMSEAGAGRIGDYEQCSYRIAGEGTFFGTESTNPQVGVKGRLAKVAEVRIEMVVPNRRLPEVIAALRRSHPYEEVAFDVYPLSAEPEIGIGRVGTLPAGTTLGKLADTLIRATKSKVTQIVGPPSAKLKRAAVCVGSAGRLPLEKPRSADCDVIVTGEVRHHDALTLLRHDKTAIALGHWESERPVLPVLARRLKQQLGPIETIISRRDKGPFAAL